MLTLKERTEFMQRLADEHPNPKSELNYTTPYELIVAVALSAQSTDKGVNIATAKLFPVAHTPEKIAALGVGGIIPYIQTIGLYRSKAKHIVEMAEMILKDFGGKVPERFEDLIKLPGVGRKTANVVLNVAFHQPRIAVDTHIFRVCNRTDFAPGKTPDDVEDALYKQVPPQFLENAHHWILLHGRYICKARSPECERCPIAEFCNAPEKAERLNLDVSTKGSLPPKPLKQRRRPLRRARQRQQQKQLQRVQPKPQPRKPLPKRK